ncbi:MAG: hypothetical protein AAGF11_19095 [Myxococcota bacterium]
MRASALGTGLIIGALVSIPGCGVESFQCSQHANCEADGVGGSCEASGYCSFPDPSCSSGRRYGEHAGDMLGHMCVPVDDEAGDTAAVPPGMTSAMSASEAPSSSTGGAESTDGGSSDGVIPGLDTGTAGISDTTADGSDTTGSAQCEFDEFDDLGSRWINWNSQVPVTVNDGHAVYDLGGQGGYNGLHGARFGDFREAVLWAEVVQVFDPSAYSRLEVGVTDELDSWVYAFVGEGHFGLFEHAPNSTMILVQAPAPPFSDRLHLTLELSGGQMRAIGSADDGPAIVLPWYPAPAWVADSTIMLDGSVFENVDAGVVLVDRFGVCGVP